MWPVLRAEICHTEVTENGLHSYMLRECSHQFVWPRRATDGRYYQVCRICEAEYEYDWESMQRLQSENLQGENMRGTRGTQVEGNGKAETATATATVPEIVVRTLNAQPRGGPRLRLLLESEPAHRIFLRNLTDLVPSRTPPPVATTSAPAPFWSDVFVPSSVPWWWFVESLLGHMILVAIVVILVPKWPASAPLQRRAFDKSYVSYYAPPKSFPALGSHTARAKPKSKRLLLPPRQPTIRVAPERAKGQGPQTAQQQAMIHPPVIAPGSGKGLRIAASNSPAPMMPLSATGRAHMTVPAGPTWVVPPPPDSKQAMGRGTGLLQPSAVAPAPEVAGVSSGRAGAATPPHAGVIAPPPSVPGSIRRIGDLNIGESAVVKPAPQLPMDAQGTVSGMAKAGLGTLGGAVVPPPPSVQASGALSGGRAGLLPGIGSQVVPPAPSIQGAGSAAGGGRGNSLSAVGSQVVPPAPSVLGAGNVAGSGRTNSFSTGGLQVVGPAPSIQGAGNGAGSGRMNSLSGDGSQAVPPAPSLQGEGSGVGNGRGNSLSGAGLAGAPPGSSGEDAGNSGAGGLSNELGRPSDAAAKSATTADSHEPPTEEIPLRLIGPVLALPGSSYFSNYEVFLAERRLAKGQSQFIKLVYVSLPYQRRLAEYGPNNWTVPKLRVTRDQTCDESLLQMTWPETDPRPDSQHSADSPALSAQDRKGMLPCYRTTADDYRRALSRNH